MKEYIRLQYEMYKMGVKGIGIDKIRKLAQKYMTKEEQNELFAE